MDPEFSPAQLAGVSRIEFFHAHKQVRVAIRQAPCIARIGDVGTEWSVAFTPRRNPGGCG
jgi:hypothetical protein